MKCTNCGAPLPSAAPGDHGTCEYCGTAWRVPDARVVTHTRRVVVTSEVEPASTGGWGLFAVPLLLLGIGGLVYRAADSVDGQAGASIARAVVAQASTVPKAGLAEAPQGTWFHIDQDGMVGDLEHFDPVDNYAWAWSWARAWAPDARLDYFFVNHVSVDGWPLDFVNDDKASYDIRFVSPTLLEAAKKMAEVSEEEVASGIRLWGQDGKMRAMVTSMSVRQIDGTLERLAKGPAPASLGCALADVVASARDSGKAAKQPFYDLRMWNNRGWRWSVDKAYVDVSDCSVR